MEKTSHRNSLKLTETLSELEAALQAWDKVEPSPEPEISSENTPANIQLRKKTQDLLRQLREQIQQFSEDV